MWDFFNPTIYIFSESVNMVEEDLTGEKPAPVTTPEDFVICKLKIKNSILTQLKKVCKEEDIEINDLVNQILEDYL